MPTGPRFVFEPFELDSARRRLTASGEPVAVSERQLDDLLLLVRRAGQIISRDDLLQAGWKDVAVGDNSLEQAISSLRRLLGRHPSGAACIETVPRRGYVPPHPMAQLGLAACGRMSPSAPPPVVVGSGLAGCRTSVVDAAMYEGWIISRTPGRSA